MPSQPKMPIKHNWKSSTYTDARGTRHKDPYQVLVLSPVDPSATAPTWDDLMMFLQKMLEVEQWNDDHLRRRPQIPEKLQRLKTIISGFDGVPPPEKKRVKVHDFY